MNLVTKDKKPYNNLLRHRIIFNVDNLYIEENHNTRIYFHLICLSILILGVVFLAYKLILEYLSSKLVGLSRLFG